MRGKGNGMLLPAVVFMGVIGIAGAACILLIGARGNEARAETRSERTSTEIKLGAGRKLVDVTWRCFGDYPCRPFLVTRAMRKDESVESYELSSPYDDAPDGYVIRESR